MFRVFLIPTEEFGKKEMWLDAHTVIESDCGEFWDFVDREGELIQRLAKCSVKSFEVAADRRKSRHWLEQGSAIEDVRARLRA